jgi:hypothetical protein
LVSPATSMAGIGSTMGHRLFHSVSLTMLIR